MDIKDMLEKAEELAKNVSDEQIDQGVELLDSKVEDKYDGAIEAAGAQAKKLND